MRTVIVGGGPAGLCAAMLLKTLRRSDVTVFERDRPDQTYGWGITLPRMTVAKLERRHPAVAAAVMARSVTWDRIHVFHRGRRVEIAGTGLIGISRVALLQALHDGCEAAGAQLRFNAPIDPDALPDCDLLVAADGANSLLRNLRADVFGTTVRPAQNRYVWLGTPHLFEGLSLLIARDDAGIFIAHAYPFSAASSTFIVECGEATWVRAHLDTMPEVDTCEYLARLFLEPLAGRPVEARSPLRWRTFNHVANERWHDGHMVLTGDAAHAIHFSVGSGTMLAIDDALALAASVAEHSQPVALAEYQEQRQPAVEGYRVLERTTVARLEAIENFIELEPLELVYQLLSR